MASFNDYIANNFPCAPVMREGFESDQDWGEDFTVTESGSPRIRRLYSNAYYDLTIRVGKIPNQKVADIRDKYSDNNDLDTLTDPMTGRIYSVVWKEPPRVVSSTPYQSVVEFSFYGAEL